MRLRALLLPLSLTVAFAVGACQTQGPSTRIVDNDDEIDEDPPEIEHEADPSYRVQGEPIYINATVTDASLIEEASIVFRRADSQEWTTLRMPSLTDEFYEGIIPGDQVYSAGMRYYLTAVDEFGNEACAPAACAEEAWYFPVGPSRD